MAFSLNTVTNHDPGQTFRDIRGANGKLLFRIQTESLEQLESLVREGIHSEQAMEVGGLVIGTGPAANDPVEKMIGFVPVEMSNIFGAAYRPGVADRQIFDEVLSQYPADGDLRAAGYFRSHFGDAEIREEDRWLMQRLFGSGGGLLVLIHAGKFRWSVLHIYRRTGRAEFLKLQEVPIAEILQTAAPFSGAREIRPVPDTPQPFRRPVEPEFQEPQPVLRPVEPEFPEDRELPWDSFPVESFASRNRNVFIGAGVLVMLLASFAIGRTTALAKRPVAAAAAPVGLSVAMQGDQVQLRWNPASPLVKNAASASLVIVDSGDADRVDLNNAQVAAGMYEYRPHGSNLTFQIMFHHADDTFAGETRSFHAQLSGPAPASDSRLPASLDRGNKFGTPAAGPQAPVPEVTQVAKAFSNPNPGGFVPPSAPAAEPPSIRLESPPALAPPPPQSHEPVVANLVASPPPVNATEREKPLEQNTKPVPAKSPVFSPPVFSPPIALKQVAPATPVDLRSLVRSQMITIGVLVDIDRNGKVTNARTTDDKGPLERILAREALQAARGWEFKAALRDGTPVASQMVLQFQFKK
jgi:TonB family protein